MEPRRIEEAVFRALMLLSVVVLAASLGWVVLVVLARGLPALSLEMITQVPKGGYYLGGEGGVLNAITGSLCLAFGATAAALVLSLPIVFFLQKEYGGRSRLAALTRLSLDVMWGIPSIVYGVFVYALMLYFGLPLSLLGGIIALCLVELPIMARAMHEVVRMVPAELSEASYALGATRLETASRVIWRHALPGLLTAVFLAFGRGIGDAASILFTAGYTDRLPSSLTEPVASLPMAVFSLSQTPIAAVRDRAYASGAILLAIVLLLSIICRLLAKRSEAHIAR
jgi:phosphate transport system permease protein